MLLDGQGVSTELPPGWEGRITRREQPAPLPGPSAAPAGGGAAPGEGARPQGSTIPGTTGIGTAGERTFPIAHLANFALPEDRGDFGSGAVELMGPDNLFVCLFEYGPESVGMPLFAAQGMPRDLRVSQFNPRALQRIIPGQAGLQQFFTEAGRAFCLFVVLGAQKNAGGLVPAANGVLRATTIEPR